MTQLSEAMLDALTDAAIGGKLLPTVGGYMRPGEGKRDVHRATTIYALERRGMVTFDDQRTFARCTDEGRAWAQASIDILRGGPAA